MTAITDEHIEASEPSGTDHEIGVDTSEEAKATYLVIHISK